MARTPRSKQPQETQSKPTNQKGNSLKMKLDYLVTIDPLTEHQKEFFNSYKRQDYFIILHGCAGTGKTFIALYKTLEEVLEPGNSFERIIIVRSAVQGREIGHTPGSVEEKMALYESPYIQICSRLFERKDAYERLTEQGYIEFLSTSFSRGTTFDNSIVIVDEMQNLTFEELDTIITRVGNESKIIFCGDYRQTDLRKSNDKSGINKFLAIAERMKSFTKIEFTVDDIVRSSLVKEYIVAKTEYEDERNP
jgi:phosphate starvation-inducible PhoH-like protein